MKKTFWIVLATVVILGGYAWTSYNSFVGLNTAANGQWANVETVLQRRFDLVPNLVASVQGALKQEKDIFLGISEARTRYAGATTIDEKAAAASQYEGAVGRLLVVMENYPQLGSSKNISDLMTQLEGTENRISTERIRFNDTVGALNLKVQRFPSNLMAKLFGFSSRNFFEVAKGADQVPQVKL